MGTRSRAWLIAAFLLAAIPLLGQSRSTRGTAPRPNAPAATPAESQPQPPAAVPAPVTIPWNGAGVVLPPQGGYVRDPERAPAGSVTEPIIQVDPVDQTYWPLYDRERPITLTGKVTRVDWTTPNSYIFMMAESGLWAIESSFGQFRQARVTPAVRVDEVITVMGYLPRAGASEVPLRRFATAASYLKANHLIRAGEITTVFGQKLTLGKPPTDEELAARFTCPALDC